MERDSGAGVVVEIELTAGARLPTATERPALLYVLLRWRGRPVGRMVLEGDRLPGPDAFRDAALECAAAAILAMEIEKTGGDPSLRSLRSSAAPPAVPPSDVSVVVATRDRPSDLSECLEALAGLDPSPGEVRVVDSASRDADAVRTAAGRWGALLTRLDEPGLSRARNAGARAAGGGIVAFLDDDCRVDEGWLRSLCAGFGDPRVEAVTGALLPKALETRAQRLLLRYTHMDRRGFAPHRFHRDIAESPHWPLDVWRIGSGGNLAIRRNALEKLGGFRTSLGLGTRARGGEDLFLLWELIREGGTVVYRPDAMVWHHHHRTQDALRRMLFGYGAGHAAYLRAALDAGASRRGVRFYRMSFYADRLLRLGRSLTGIAGYPASLVLRELAGSVGGRWRAPR